MQRSLRLAPWFAVLSSVILWGVSFVCTKVLLEEYPPVSIAWFRLFPALLLLAVMVLRRKERLVPQRQDWWKFVLGAAFGIVLYMVLENGGMQHTSASTASMLVASIPVFVLIIESLVSRVPVRFDQLVPILLSLAGVWLILFNGVVPDFSGSSFTGNLMVLGAMAAWIVYTFITRDLGKRYSGLQQTTIQSLFALVLYLPFLVGDIPHWHLPSLQAVMFLLFLGALCSGLAYVTWLYALKALGTVLPSAFLNAVALVTIVTAMIAIAELPGLWQFAGIFLIVGSLTFMSWRTWRKSGATSRDAS